MSVPWQVILSYTYFNAVKPIQKLLKEHRDSFCNVLLFCIFWWSFNAILILSPTFGSDTTDFYLQGAARRQGVENQSGAKDGKLTLEINFISKFPNLVNVMCRESGKEKPSGCNSFSTLRDWHSRVAICSRSNYYCNSFHCLVEENRFTFAAIGKNVIITFDWWGVTIMLNSEEN